MKNSKHIVAMAREMILLCDIDTDSAIADAKKFYAAVEADPELEGWDSEELAHEEYAYTGPLLYDKDGKCDLC